MPKVSYGFAVGNLRAREVSLLTRADIEQMLSFDSTAALAAFLRDKGFSSPAEQVGLFDMLENEARLMWEYLLSIAPDAGVFDAFLYLNDYHNLKVILKGTVRRRDYEPLLMSPVTVPVKTLETAVCEKRFELLAEPMRTAAENAYTALTRDNDAQLCDALLDTACMQSRLAAAHETKIPLLIETVTAQVFYSNLKVAIRCARAQKSAEFINTALCEDGIIDKKALAAAALSGVDEVLELMENRDKLNSAGAAAAYRESPGEFEKYTDNLILRIARKGKYVTTGADVLVGYLIARKTELTAARIIGSGIKTGQSQQEIRERLRELYG